jgi:hypothetical protein
VKIERARQRLAAWWLSPAPAERLALVRIAIGGFALIYVLARLPELLAVARLSPAHFAPVGIVRWLGGPWPVGLVLAVAAATCVALAAFVLGIAYRYVAPLAALGLVVTLSYRTSWGQVFHTENLLVLHVIALACAPAADAWALGARTQGDPARYVWPIKLLVAVTTATYVIAGLAKLRLAGAGWLDGSQLADQIALDNVRKALLGARTAPLATFVLAHPLVLQGLSIATLAIELFAPIALFGGRIARAWALGAWAFHVGVLATMYVVFPYQLLGVAYLPVLVAGRRR